MEKNKVLILLDGSEFRRRILPYVQQFLRPEDNQLLLFRVAEQPHPMLYMEGVIIHDVIDNRDRETITEQLRQEMLDTKLLLEESGYTVNRVVRFGGIASEVVTVIEQEQIDLVAMTTHGRSGIGKLIYGSIAEYVLRNVSIPIMLLRSAA